MSYMSILVGIDGSPAAMAAARAGRELARRTGGVCRFVHATYDVSAIPSLIPEDADAAALNSQVTRAERDRIAKVLTKAVGGFDPDDLIVRVGTPRWVLKEVTEELGADVVMLGGKHHATLARWLGGSTAHHLVQTLDRPVLVMNPERPELRRIMAAIDLSEASEGVLRAAEDLAAAMDGDLKIVHVIEPLPAAAHQLTVFNHAAFVEWSETTFDEVGGRAGATVERELLRGQPEETIAAASAGWAADVLVVGSHGRGFVNRMLLGSTAHRLLTRLPTSLLVVPVGAIGDREHAPDTQAAEGAVLG